MNRIESALAVAALTAGINGCAKPEQVRPSVDTQSKNAAVSPAIPSAIATNTLTQTQAATAELNPYEESNRAFETQLDAGIARILRSNHIHEHTDGKKARNPGAAIETIAEQSVGLCIGGRQTTADSECDPTTCVSTMNYYLPVSSYNPDEISTCIDAGFAEDAAKIPAADTCKLHGIAATKLDESRLSVTMLVECTDNGTELPKPGSTNSMINAIEPGLDKNPAPASEGRRKVKIQ